MFQVWFMFKRGNGEYDWVAGGMRFEQKEWGNPILAAQVAFPDLRYGGQWRVQKTKTVKDVFVALGL